MPDTFRNWRARLNLTQEQAARALGYGTRQIGKFDNGRPPPLWTRLAMSAVEARLVPVKIDNAKEPEPE